LKTERVLPSICAFLVAVYLGCAKQAPPPGGPEDRVPPEVASVEPPSGTTEVAPGRAVELYFSKSMQRREVEGALHIFPPLSNPPDLDWDGPVLRIRPDTAWDPDQTYIVTVHGDAVDNRGNRLRQTFQSAFSTGTVIDSGMVGGQILRQGAMASGVLALCYRLDGGDVDPESDTADYVVQVDVEGYFQFEFLGPGSYRIFGLDDRDRDWLWNVGVEEIAVPSTDVELNTQGAVAGISPLYLTKLDTVRPVITACEVVSPQFLMLEFDRGFDSVDVKDMRVELVTPSHHVRADQLYALDSLVQTVYARFDTVSTDTTYDVAWSTEGPVPASDTCRLDWVPPERGQRLEAPSLKPDSLAVWTHRPDGLYLHFAQPLASVDPALFSLRSDTGSMAPSVTLPSPFSVRIDLGDGQPGTLAIDPGAVVADQGGRWPDSQAVSLPIRMPQADSSGGFELYFNDGWSLTSDLNIRLVPTFRPEGARLLSSSVAQPVSGTMLQGEYGLSLLWDANGDGHWTGGWPYPFRPAEQRQALPDTLRIRARFTTEYRIPVHTKNQLP
jgi:hypothetical protein